MIRLHPQSRSLAMPLDEVCGPSLYLEQFWGEPRRLKCAPKDKMANEVKRWLTLSVCLRIWIINVIICSSLCINERASPQWSDKVVLSASLAAASDNVIIVFTLYRYIHLHSLSQALLMKIILLVRRCSSCGLCMWGYVCMSVTEAGESLQHVYTCCCTPARLMRVIVGAGETTLGPNCSPSTKTAAAAAAVSLAAHTCFGSQWEMTLWLV